MQIITYAIHFICPCLPHQVSKGSDERVPLKNGGVPCDQAIEDDKASNRLKSSPIPIPGSRIDRRVISSIEYPLSSYGQKTDSTLPIDYTQV